MLVSMKGQVSGGIGDDEINIEVTWEDYGSATPAQVEKQVTLLAEKLARKLVAAYVA